MKTAKEVFDEVVAKHYHHPQYQWEYEEDVVIECMNAFADQFRQSAVSGSVLPSEQQIKEIIAWTIRHAPTYETRSQMEQSIRFGDFVIDELCKKYVGKTDR